MHSTTDRTERVLFALLVLGLAVAPFWFASNTQAAWAINALYYGGLLIAYELSRLIQGRPHPVSISFIWFPAVAVAIAMVWILVQWSPWTPDAWHHPIWSLASEALGEPLTGRITVAPQSTALAALRLLTFISVFWLSLQLCRSARRAFALMGAIAVIGIFYAGYGILNFLFFPDHLLWFPKRYYLESLTSTFVNRNSYATYAGVTLLACFGTLFTIYGRAAEEAGNLRRHQIAAVIQSTAGLGGVMLVGFFIIMIALMLTASRAGIGVSLAGLMVLVGLFVSRGGKQRQRLGWIIIPVVAIALAGISIYGDLFFQRMDVVANQAGSRLAVYRLTLRSIWDSPLLGMGYGTFRDIFPMYRDTSVPPWVIWDKAHDTYLEVLQGLGIPVGLILIAAVGFLVFLCFRGVGVRRRGAAVPAVVAASCVTVGLHSVVDFSLQMEAVALTWTSMLGMGVAQSWSSQRDLEDASSESPLQLSQPRRM